MLARLQSLRESATVAHVLPLALFLSISALPAMLAVANPELPWHRQAPEHWIYPIQTLFIGVVLVFFGKHYTFRPWRGLKLAVLLAVVGIAMWITPAWIYERNFTSPEAVLGWLAWLGVEERRDGFNPDLLAAWPGWQTASVVMRFVRLVIIVPLVEELFWRGFLMRYVNAGDRAWQSVPFGEHSWRTFIVVTSLVVVAHQPADYVAAVVWGSLVYYLAVRTRSLGACVTMHAVANLLLGLYVMQTRQWGFW